MCQHEQRTSALTLQSSLLSLMIRHGLKLEQAELAAHDIVGIFARSEVTHPCWAAEALGLPQEEEEEQDAQGEQAQADDAPRGIVLGAIKLSADGVEIEAEGGLPPGIEHAIKVFGATLAQASARARARKHVQD